MPIDAKYGEILVSNEPGNPFVDNEPVFLFRAADITVPALLVVYQTLCTGRGCDQAHVAGIHRALETFRAWQRDNPDRVKRPD